MISILDSISRVCNKLYTGCFFRTVVFQYWCMITERLPSQLQSLKINVLKKRTLHLMCVMSIKYMYYRPQYMPRLQGLSQPNFSSSAYSFSNFAVFQIISNYFLIFRVKSQEQKEATCNKVHIRFLKDTSRQQISCIYKSVSTSIY